MPGFLLARVNRRGRLTQSQKDQPAPTAERPRILLKWNDGGRAPTRPLSFVGLGNASVHLAISSLKSDSISLRLKRIPRPGVRIEGSLPVFFHQSTVFGDTRKNSATSGTVKRLGMFNSVVFCSPPARQYGPSGDSPMGRHETFVTSQHVSLAKLPSAETIGQGAARTWACGLGEIICHRVIRRPWSRTARALARA